MCSLSVRAERSTWSQKKASDALSLVMCLASLGPGRRRRFRRWLCSQEHADAVLLAIRITGHDGHFGRLTTTTTSSPFFAQAHAVPLFCEADLASAFHSQGDAFAQ